MNEEQVYVRWQDRIESAVRRLERRALDLERENETLRRRVADLENPDLNGKGKKKPGPKPKQA